MYNVVRMYNKWLDRSFDGEVVQVRAEDQWLDRALHDKENWPEQPDDNAFEYLKKVQKHLDEKAE